MLNRKAGFQKDVLYRVLKLHCLRSKAEAFELLQLAIDDPVVFDLTYDRLLEKIAAVPENEGLRIDTSDDGDCIVESTPALLDWLAVNRSIILAELDGIVTAMGGIEIASYLIEQEREPLQQEVV